MGTKSKKEKIVRFSREYEINGRLSDDKAIERAFNHLSKDWMYAEISENSDFFGVEVIKEKVITIEVRGGLIQEIYNIPDKTKIRIIDYDNDPEDSVYFWNSIVHKTEKEISELIKKVTR